MVKLEAYVAGGVGQNARLLAKLSARLGGVTVVPSFGHWIDPDGRLEAEQASIIVCFGTRGELVDAKFFILDFALDAREKTVGFWNGIHFSIEETGAL